MQYSSPSCGETGRGRRHGPEPGRARRAGPWHPPTPTHRWSAKGPPWTQPAPRASGQAGKATATPGNFPAGKEEAPGLLEPTGPRPQGPVMPGGAGDLELPGGQAGGGGDTGAEAALHGQWQLPQEK